MIPPRPVGNLVGLTAPQLAALLGTPDFRRNDGPSEIYQYRTPECILDVFLYPDQQGQAIATYAESRNQNLAVIEVADCANRVAHARKK